MYPGLSLKGNEIINTWSLFWGKNLKIKGYFSH